jgi:hypothetical protein
MSFNIALPLAITSSQIDFTSCIESEDLSSALAPYSAYAGGATYGLGDRVFSATSHHVYQSLQASNTGHSPLVAANIGVWWADGGADNLYRPFDNVTTNQCQKSGVNIRYRLICTAAVSVVALFGMTGKYVSVMHYDTDAARRNLITYSADQSNAVYATTGLAALTVNAVQDQFGGPFGTFIQEDASTGNHQVQFPLVSYTSGLTYTASAYVKRAAVGATRDVAIRFAATSFSTTPQAAFNLTTLAITNSGGGTGAITAVGNGYYRISVTAVCDTTASGRANLYIYNGAISYTGNNVSGLNVSSFQIELASSVGVYQWIEDATRWGDVLYSQYQIISNLFSTNAIEAIFTGLNADVGDYIDITVSPMVSTGIAGVSEIALAYSYPIGDTENGPTVTLVDYSNTSVDTFGNTVLVRRSYVKKLDCNVRIAKTAVAQTLNFFASFRAIPVVAFDDSDVSNGVGSSSRGVLIYGINTNAVAVANNAPILAVTMRGL